MGRHPLGISMNPLVKITVSLLVATKNDGQTFLAKCPFLNIVTQGSSKKQALGNLKEEINFFFESCLHDNTLIDVMDHRTAMSGEPHSPDEFVMVEPTYVEIPAGIPPEVLRLLTDVAVPVA